MREPWPPTPAPGGSLHQRLDTADILTGHSAIAADQQAPTPVNRQEQERLRRARERAAAEQAVDSAKEELRRAEQTTVDHLASDYRDQLEETLDILTEHLIREADPVVQAQRVREREEYEEQLRATRAAQKAERQAQREEAEHNREMSRLTRELKRLQTKAKVILTTKRSMFKDSQEYKALGSLRKRIRLYEGMLEAGWDTPITLPEVLLERPSGKKKFRRGPAARHPFPFGWELENERRRR
jgi:hypothetical protein